MSGFADGYRPDDAGLEPRADTIAANGPGDAETTALATHRGGDEMLPEPGDAAPGELATGPADQEVPDRAEPATEAGSLAVAATATFNTLPADVATADGHDDGVRIPAQAGGYEGVGAQAADAGRDEAAGLPDQAVERAGTADGVETQGADGDERTHIGDSQAGIAEGTDVRADAAQAPDRPRPATGHNAFATTFEHMSSTEVTQWRGWAEAIERRAEDTGADPRSRNNALFELRTNGSGRFLEHYREAEAETFRSRRSALEDLEHTGFNGQQIHDLRGMIAASGLPTHGLSEFVHEPDRAAIDANGNSGGQVIASMHTHGEYAGRFTVHDCFDEAPIEEKKATVVHEMTHNLSALRPENNEVFGEGEAGEQARLEIAEYVSRVVDQSLLTGVHLNGYHKHLLNEYNETKRLLDAARSLDPNVEGQHITQREYEEYLAAARYKLAEETQAILTEMSFFKRAELERVQADQAQKLEDMARIARIDPQSELLPESVRGLGIDGIPDQVGLVTNQTERGHAAQGVGADRIAITLLRNVGVNNYDDLIRHIDRFKGNEWGHESPRVQARRAAQLARERERKLALIRQLPPRQL